MTRSTSPLTASNCNLFAAQMSAAVFTDGVQISPFSCLGVTAGMLRVTGQAFDIVNEKKYLDRFAAQGLAVSVVANLQNLTCVDYIAAAPSCNPEFNNTVTYTGSTPGFMPRCISPPPLPPAPLPPSPPAPPPACTVRLALKRGAGGLTAANCTVFAFQATAQFLTSSNNPWGGPPPVQYGPPPEFTCTTAWPSETGNGSSTVSEMLVSVPRLLNQEVGVQLVRWLASDMVPVLAALGFEYGLNCSNSDGIHALPECVPSESVFFGPYTPGFYLPGTPCAVPPAPPPLPPSPSPPSPPLP
eukprot:CAMPEP_0202891192 /NCGR_PEP_ID=MMETSP1392-20130828/1318_1 /ASSEMBLY_ACC=CAM_ASM_000868 /TAXON_ID=225041 /ORGANISM="Chlamydomonas chlamydogama, Strain SAG 11-48b" /LENGTH=299 /DNA_ID=CAMNT_0049574877 /DNA_START=20 /DNA_END=915 /DNA_ORIENTATION=+